MFEAEIGELFGDGFAEFWDDFLTGGGEFRAALPKVLFEFAKFQIEAFEFRVARFERLKFGAGFVAELYYFVECRAVFSLEKLHDVDALFEFVEAGRVDFNGIGVMAEFALEIVNVADKLGMEFGDVFCAGIESRKFLKRTANRTGLSEDAGFIFAKASEGGLGEFDEASGVAGASVIGFDLGFFARDEFRAGDFLHLKTEQIELLGVSALIDDEFTFLPEKFGAAGNFLGERGARLGEFTVGIEDIELLGGMQQRLMIVRTVHIDQHFADGSEDRESGG